jgi:methionine-S-sulfoxide reductase
MRQERSVLAGGCFWGMQDLIRKRDGVISTRVGYSGGDVPNATYRNHGTHAEAIEIVFDPDRLSFRELLEFFFQIHDPTTRNRQGNDVGTSYRSAIYTTSDEQRRIAQDTIADRSLGLVAWPRGHGGGARGPVLGGGARAPGLSRAHSARVHLPLRPPGLATAGARQERQGQLRRGRGDPSYNRFRRRPICR